MSQKLSEKVALVTGGTSGIGRATVIGSIPNFDSRRTFALSRRWTHNGSRSRLCLGASGLPLA
jgi:hypothetical protein